MKKKYKDGMNYTWIVTSEVFKEKLSSKNINAIVLGTDEFKKYIKKTDVFFTTHCNLTGDKTDKAMYIELWHGISSKKVGFMMSNISNADKAWYEHLSKTVDYFIVPSEFWTTIFSARFNVNIKQVLPIGYPKLDFIKNKNAFKNLSKLLNKDLSNYKKIIFYNIESRLLHCSILIIMYTEKSSALRRRTKLSTQPFIYRILVSGKLSTQPLIYRILVSGKLSLYLYFNKYKEKSQDDFPLLFYADSSSNIPSFPIHPMNRYIYHYTC